MFNTKNKTIMSKNKSKIIKWEYVIKPFDAYVDPERVKRVHAPLEKSLTPDTGYGEYLHLRPCVRGVNEYGATVRYLYCTRDGRFFVSGKDGWNEVKPGGYYSDNKKPKASGGSTDCPQMQHFGSKTAHRCVAVAWYNPPAEALAEINNKDAKRKWEVDHLNTDHKNWTADNLQWVTTDENLRRGRIARLMRQIGLDPKLLTPTLCKGIYGLPRGWVSILLGNFLIRCNNDPSQLSVENIRIAVACSLDEIRDTMKHVKCKEPDNKKAL